MAKLSGEADWTPTKLPFSDLVSSFVSGEQNEDRIQIAYFKTKVPDVLYGRIIFGKLAEGPPGHVHGGAQAAVLDEICGGAVWISGHKVVAAKLETHFIQMVPLHQVLTLKAVITSKEGRKVTTEGTLSNGREQILAKATVLFIELSEKQMNDLGNSIIKI